MAEFLWPMSTGHHSLVLSDYHPVICENNANVLHLYQVSGFADILDKG